MQKVYQDFVDILSGQPDQRELEIALVRATGKLGIPMFGYLLLPEQRSAPSLISNYPSGWTQHYLAKRYDRLDPVIGAVARTTEPFAWGPDLRTGRRLGSAARFFAEAAEFGIRFGLTIPIRARQKRLAAITFATHERGTVFDRSVEAYRSGLQLMALLFHRQACSAVSYEPMHLFLFTSCASWR